MKQFEVIESFNDKYTDEQYVPGVLFLCNDSDRIADLQQRGLIGEEIPLNAVVAEEASAKKEVKPNAKQSKRVVKSNT